MPVDAVKVPQENRELGVNPGRYRRCMRGGATLDESRSLGKPEKTMWKLMMRKSGELLKRGENTRVCKYGACGFLLRKNGCSDSLQGLLQLFCCDRLRVDSPFCTDCPDGHSPQTN